MLKYIEFQVTLIALVLGERTFTIRQLLALTTITVNTDKAEYVQGETVSITAVAKDQNAQPMAGITLYMRLLNNLTGAVVSGAVSASTDGTGTAAWSISNTLGMDPTTYKVQVSETIAFTA